MQVASLAELAAARHRAGVVALDVRRNLEWAGGHVDGAVHIPLHELPGRIGEVPPGQVWVYCQAGYRAALAAPLLAAAGREVVTVDYGFGGAGRSGLPLDRHEEAVA